MSHLYRVITILSTKGGVGKTTLTANLGGFLHSQGFRVLMVDADFQPALSSYYKIKDQASAGLSLLFGGDGSVSECVSGTDFGDLVVSDDPGGMLGQEVKDSPTGRVQLKQRLDSVRSDYDFILIDTQGADGALQEAAVLAADVVVVPLQPTTLAAQELVRGTLSLVNRLKGFEVYGLKVPEVQAVLWAADGTRDCLALSTELRELAEDPGYGFSLLESQVSKRAGWAESATRQRPVTALGARRKVEAAELRALALELLPQLNLEVTA